MSLIECLSPIFLIPVVTFLNMQQLIYTFTDKSTFLCSTSRTCTCAMDTTGSCHKDEGLGNRNRPKPSDTEKRNRWVCVEPTAICSDRRMLQSCQGNGIGANNLLVK